MSRKPAGGLRRRLEFTLVGVALVSVLLLSGINYAFARNLITGSVESQLTTLRDTRIQAIERGAARLQTEISTLAVTPSVITALEEFAERYRQLDVGQDIETSANLLAAYQEALGPMDEADVAELVPDSRAGRYVQDEYIAKNPYPFDERDRLDDADDGSSYSATHAVYHPLLRSLMENARMTDLLLVDAETRDVVYTVKKRIDIGADVSDGPLADTALGEVIDDLVSKPIGDAVYSDVTFYPPVGGGAVIFMAAAVRSGSDVVGAIVTVLPVDGVTDLVTAGENWDLLGLGRTGEAYLVGADGTLRTEVRQWIDDPEQFLADRDRGDDDDAVTDQIRRLGSPVLLQQIDNAAVQNALAGQEFLGEVTNYHGATTLAASGPLVIGDLDWVVVVEQERSETTQALASLLRGTLLVMAILLPTTALLGWWLARSLTRPFETLVSSAAGVARGEPIHGVAQLGNNEIGDVGRQLELVANQLAAEERAIVAEEERIIDVLGAVVPPRLIDRVRRGEQSINDLVDTATVIAVSIAGVPEATGSDQDTVLEITEQIDEELDRLMDRHGIERLRRSTSTELFVAGLGDDGARIGDAVAFAAGVLDILERVGEEFGQQLVARVGLDAGEVATGVIGRTQMTFSVWGEAVSSAFTLASLAQPGEILADADVAEGLDAGWEVEPCEGLVGLDDDHAAFRVTRLS